MKKKRVIVVDVTYVPKRERSSLTMCIVYNKISIRCHNLKLTIFLFHLFKKASNLKFPNETMILNKVKKEKRNNSIFFLKSDRT